MTCKVVFADEGFFGVKELNKNKKLTCKLRKSYTDNKL